MKRNDELRKVITKEYLLQCINEGKTIRQIALRFNVSHTFIRKIAKEQNVIFPQFNYNRQQFKGYRINDKGYVVLSIGNDKYELEHRIIVQNYILRAIKDTECVHHLNGNKQDNSPSNLLLIDKRLHDSFHTHCRNLNLIHTEQDVYTVLIDLGYNVRVEMYAELTRIYEV